MVECCAVINSGRSLLCLIAGEYPLLVYLHLQALLLSLIFGMELDRS